MNAVILSPQSLVVKLNAMMVFADSMLTLLHGERKWEMTHPPYNMRGDWRKSQALSNYQKNNICLIFHKDNTLPM